MFEKKLATPVWLIRDQTKGSMRIREGGEAKIDRVVEERTYWKCLSTMRTKDVVNMSHDKECTSEQKEGKDRAIVQVRFLTSETAFPQNENVEI